MGRADIGVAIIGMGVIGTEVVRFLICNGDRITRRSGASITLKKILVRDIDKPRDLDLPVGLLTDDPKDILEDSTIQIVIETMGGEKLALEYIRGAIAKGKHIVTANKEVISKFGAALLQESLQANVAIMFEPSVGGGIPILGPLMKDLRANEINSISAIINGTTNYILSRMGQDGVDFNVALAEAQAFGYAESDPSNDVEGLDAAYKLTILASLAFHTKVVLEDVYYEGITHLVSRDFRYAKELGYGIKLLAIAKREGEELQLRVHPALIPVESPIAKVDGVDNAIEIEGDLVGRVVFQGQGAGAKPTASAVIANLIEVVQRIDSRAWAPTPITVKSEIPVKKMANLETCYYIRLFALDRAGVLAQIAQILGDRDISIASVIQKDADLDTKSAEIVIMTHPAVEFAIQESLEQMKVLGVVQDVGNLIRVENWLP